MQIAEHLKRRLQGSNQDWLCLQDVQAFSNQLQDLFPLHTKTAQGLDYFLALLWLHELLNEDAIQILVRIFLYERRLDIRPKFFRFFLKLVDGNLSY